VRRLIYGPFSVANVRVHSTSSKMSLTESHYTVGDTQSVAVNEAGASANAGAAIEVASLESKL
jgi:hypothetical protein